jgi:hypothetical protein
VLTPQKVGFIDNIFSDTAVAGNPRTWGSVAIESILHSSTTSPARRAEKPNMAPTPIMSMTHGYRGTGTPRSSPIRTLFTTCRPS